MLYIQSKQFPKLKSTQVRISLAKLIYPTPFNGSLFFFKIVFFIAFLDKYNSQNRFFIKELNNLPWHFIDFKFDIWFSADKICFAFVFPSSCVNSNTKLLVMSIDMHIVRKRVNSACFHLGLRVNSTSGHLVIEILISELRFINW